VADAGVGAPARRSAAAFVLALAFSFASSIREARAQEPPPQKEEPDKTAGSNPDEEIVEVLEDGTSSSKAVARPEPEPAKSDKIEVRGFARATFGWGVSSQGAAPRVPALEEHVAYERVTSVNQAYLDVRYSRGKTFQAVVSGSLAYSASLIEGAAGQPLDSQDFKSVLIEPLLREAYIGIYTSRVDLRLGQQRIVWGNSEGLAPNDVLNARDTRNRMQLDSEMVNIPTLAARADFDLGIAVLGVVAQPFFVPDRASIYGGNWSLVQPDAPLHVRKFFGAQAQGEDPTEIEAGIARAKAADAAFSGASIGASLRMHFGNMDVSAYYHYGRDRSPFVYLDPEVANQLNTAKSPDDYATIFASQRKASASYGGPVVVESVRRHHIGMDLATTAGPLVLRMDGAFDTAMTFYARDSLNSVARPTAQVVAGAEYQRGFGNVLVVEASYTRLLGPELMIVPAANQANDGPLLFVKEDNLGLGSLVRWTPFENVIFEARSFVGIVPLSWVVRPEIGYASSSFTLRLGYLAIDGTGGSFGGYYRRNETIYVTSRYSF
jgi:hypothetical protein